MSPKKVAVTLTYASPGAQPPIYVAGSFSEWYPEEMEYTTASNNEHHFKKELMVEEGGKFQYKFRIGEGDWWALDESSPTVTDDLGNRNNVLTVPSEEEEPTETIISRPGEMPAMTENQSGTATSEDVTLTAEDRKLQNSEVNIEEDTEPLTSGFDAKSAEFVESHYVITSVPSKDENATSFHMEKESFKLEQSTSVDNHSEIVTTMEENPGESSGSEAILTPSTTGEKEEPVSTEEVTKESHEKTPTPPRVFTPIPEVVVEKVDDEPRHGDDFGEDATSGQKKAHEMRAQDAEPDLVVVLPEANMESNTPKAAVNPPFLTDKVGVKEASGSTYMTESKPPVQAPHEVAAEVADSASLVDKEEPQPISTAEEAGNTGERRLAHTPIPKVVTTASEVADTAAAIGVDNFNVEMPRFKFVDPDSGSASGTVTPIHEKAPLFSHECLISLEESEEKEKPFQRIVVSDEVPKIVDYDMEFDHDDPSIEGFPSDRDSILQTVRSCESRLNVDETHFEESPSSPVVEKDSLMPERDLEEHGATVPDRSSTPAHVSPVLEMIQEENYDLGESVSLPSESNPFPGLASSLAEKVLPPETTVAVQPLDNEATTLQKATSNDKSMESPLGTESLVALPVIVNDLPASEEDISEAADSNAEITIPDVIRTIPADPKISQPEFALLPVAPEASQTTSKGMDRAKSSSTETDSNVQNIKMRNAPEVKRANTPSSLSSPGKDRDARSVFAAIWHTLFVTWIGGFITRLCRGGRRPLIAVAVVLLTLAPILYMRM